METVWHQLTEPSHLFGTVSGKAWADSLANPTVWQIRQSGKSDSLAKWMSLGNGHLDMDTWTWTPGHGHLDTWTWTLSQQVGISPSQLCDFGHSSLQTLYIRCSAVFTPTTITSHNVQSYFLDITYLHNPPRDAVRPTKSGHHGRANIVTDSIRPPLPCSMLAASRMASGSSWNVAEFSGDGSTPEIHEL